MTDNSNEYARAERMFKAAMMGRRDLLRMGAATAGAASLGLWGSRARAEVGGELTLIAYEGYSLEAQMQPWREANNVTFQTTLMANQEDVTAKLVGNNPAQLDVAYNGHGYAKMYADLGLIQEIDVSRVPNYDPAKLFGPFHNNPLWAWDAKVYAIPFIWGYDSIIVNRAITQVPVKNYTDLLHPDFTGKLAFQDNPLAAWPQIAKVAGYGDKFPFLTRAELDDAFEKMIPYRDQTVVFSASNGETLNLFTSGEIAAVWASWCAIPQEGAKVGANLELILPEEGAAVWADAWVLPTTMKNTDTAYAFLNEALQPEVQAAIAEFGFCSPVAKGSVPLLKPEIKSLFDFDNFDAAFANITIPGQPLREAEGDIATFDDWLQKWSDFRAGF